MKAIETKYNGYRFRSRLEARWAVFFDAMKIPYQYEREGFDIDGVRYLPDFWLPAQGYYVEIKGVEPSQEDINKMGALHTHSGQHVYCFYGDCWLPSEGNRGCLVGGDVERGYYLFKGQEWTECLICHKVDIAFIGMAAGMPCQCFPDSMSIFNFETATISTGALIIPTSRKIIDAFIAAREARFEHGESPK